MITAKWIRLIIYLTLISPNAFTACTGINCDCQIVGASTSYTMNFSYSPLSGNAATSSTNISITCTAFLLSLLVSYQINLSTGSSNTFTARTMKLNTNNLLYNIFTNANYTTIWGDGTGGSSFVSDSYLLGLLGPVTRSYTAYGNVPASQNVPAGTYNDILTVTLIY